jgi:prepilin-type N-terminal cleavage/methylation domain-containing protein
MRRRSAFTLVEVLVAMALILFIMTILAAAFGSATQAVSDFKAAGDLAQRLRVAANVLKRDVEQDHFTDGPQVSPRLSDYQSNTVNFWSRLTSATPPTGFFRIYEGAIPPNQLPLGSPPQGSFDEGIDLDGFHSFRTTRTALHYTIALHGTRRSDFLSASVQPNTSLTTAQNPPTAMDLLLKPPDTRYQDTQNTYNSQYAEVAVFLARIPSYDTTDGTNGLAPMPLYALYRRQFLAVPNTWAAVPPISNDQLTNLEMSTVPTAGELPATSPLTFNSMQDLTQPVKRFWMQRGAVLQGAYQPVPVPVNPAPPPPSLPYPAPQTGFDPTDLIRYENMGESNNGFQNADLLLSDVVSFDVRVLVQGGSLVPGGPVQTGSDFEDLFQLTNTNRTDPMQPANQWYFPPNNPGFGNDRVFDTWSNLAPSYTAWQTPNTLASPPIFKDNNNNPIIIKAIQITLRVWDFKTKKTRQVTIVQQM